MRPFSRIADALSALDFFGIPQYQVMGIPHVTTSVALHGVPSKPTSFSTDVSYIDQLLIPTFESYMLSGLSEDLAQVTNPIRVYPRQAAAQARRHPLEGEEGLKVALMVPLFYPINDILVDSATGNDGYAYLEDREWIPNGNLSGESGQTDFKFLVGDGVVGLFELKPPHVVIMQDMRDLYEVLKAGVTITPNGRCAFSTPHQGRGETLVRLIKQIFSQFLSHPKAKFLIISNYEASMVIVRGSINSFKAGVLIDRSSPSTERNPIGSVFNMLLALSILRDDAYAISELPANTSSTDTPQTVGEGPGAQPTPDDFRSNPTDRATRQSRAAQGRTTSGGHASGSRHRTAADDPIDHTQPELDSEGDSSGSIEVVTPTGIFLSAPDLKAFTLDVDLLDPSDLRQASHSLSNVTSRKTSTVVFSGPYDSTQLPIGGGNILPPEPDTSLYGSTVTSLPLKRLVSYGATWDVFELGTSEGDSSGLVIKLCCPKFAVAGGSGYSRGDPLDINIRLRTEIAAYCGPLSTLSCNVVPAYHGLYVGSICGAPIYGTIMADGGPPISTPISYATRKVIRGHYRAMHRAGVLHNDLDLRHWRRSADDHVRVIDFDSAILKSAINDEAHWEVLCEDELVRVEGLLQASAV